MAFHARPVVGIGPEYRLVVGCSHVEPVDRMGLDIMLGLLAADLIFDVHVGRVEGRQALRHPREAPAGSADLR